jgi:hypothetical protein
MLGALAAGTARGVGEDALAPCSFQRGNLQRGILIIRRDAGIADFHAAIFGLNYRTRKLLFLWAFVFVRKTILYRTVAKPCDGRELSTMKRSPRHTMKRSPSL